MLRKTLQSLSGNILVFASTDLLGNFARSMVFSYSSLYILALGGDANSIGLANFLSLLAGLIILPVAGYITDHTDRIHVLVYSGVFSGLALLVTIFAPSWQIIAFSMFLFNLALFQFPAYSALIADSLSHSDRGRDLGLMNTISNFPAIVAPYLAGLIITIYTADLGMRILYAALMVTYLLGAAIQGRFLREESAFKRERFKLADLAQALEQTFSAIPAMLKQMSPSLQSLTWVILLSFMANAVASSFWVVYATEQIGFTAAQWGLILLVESVVRLIVYLPAGLLCDKWGKKNVLLTALVISLVAVPLFVIVKGFTAILLIRMALAAAFSLAIPACTALMADLVPRVSRGQMMAAIGQGSLMIAPTGGGIGGPALGYIFIPPVMIASLAGGYLYTLNPVYPWIFSGVTTLISILVTLFGIHDAQNAEK
jgi:MFS family permease